jgi:hypothetical protein
METPLIMLVLIIMSGVKKCALTIVKNQHGGKRNESPVIYGPMYTPNFVLEVYDPYRAYTWCTKLCVYIGQYITDDTLCILGVHGPYALYVWNTRCTGRMLDVHNFV